MYNLNSKKTNLKIALFSDLHYSDRFNIKILDEIINRIKKLNPDYICIPGDIIEESIYGDDILYDFFKALSKKTKVIISLGNHDISIFKKRKQIYKPNNKWFLKLNNLKNVFVLDNEQLIDNNITFTGYTLAIEDKYYDNPDRFLNDLKKLNFNLNKENYNILLCHSPQCISNNKNILNNKFIKEQDLILCGHMHNGMVPSFLDKIFRCNRGFIGPGIKILPKFARGLIRFNKTNLIISKGILKLSKHAPNILKFFNVFYPFEIEIIKIKKI